MCVDKENRLIKKTVVFCPALISVGRFNPISAGFIGRPASENLINSYLPLIKYCFPS